ncbi:hypothetical protein DPMN_134507 [Dreissena polymorpha]|uniref:Uncharacterized protein n=1 Tax=Dreissena polymorpha TaxID=45954 RepID=A0A9D4G084_DREPO|nr:hypothetical protein DPMN_134507 [Dreissena polymorpha]
MTVRQIAAISERERGGFGDKGRPGHASNEGRIGHRQGHLYQGGPDILDAAIGPRVRRVSSVPGWARRIGRHQRAKGLA